ncbi:MAG: DUF3343 domain-containing protein [Elusimicrobia bacterium]|nr:DUF3343 domain-containing protein [Elusimicrobiota bacterium]
MKIFIISFDNTHKVLSAEKKLKEIFNGVTTIPTPEILSTDCGVSLQVEASKKEDIIAQLQKLKLSFQNITESSENYSSDSGII